MNKNSRLLRFPTDLFLKREVAGRVAPVSPRYSQNHFPTYLLLIENSEFETTDNRNDNVVISDLR